MTSLLTAIIGGGIPTPGGGTGGITAGPARNVVAISQKKWKCHFRRQ